MAPRAVAGHVDEDPVARLGRAHAEALVLARSDDERQTGRAPRAPRFGHAGMRGVEMYVPRPRVVTDEYRRTAVLGQQEVGLQRGGRHVTIATQLEHHAKVGGEEHEGIHVGAREGRTGERADLPGAGSPSPNIVGHVVATGTVDAGREVIDDRRSDEHDVISV